MLFFLSDSNIFENSCVNIFQCDFISIGKIENHFKAAPSRVVWITTVRLCIHFSWSGVFTGSGPILKLNLL